MKSIQLIFCVETNKKSDTDFKYLLSAVRQFYQIGSHVRIDRVYMDGRGNYCVPKVEKQIRTLVNQFQASNRDNVSYAIYCFDCDKYDVKPEDRQFLSEASQYCAKDKFRRFVWFCRDIEDVFLGKQIDDKQKTREANHFQVRKMIQSFDFEKLTAKEYKPHYSNLCLVLDEFLERK